MENLKQYVGKKVKGVKFETKEYRRRNFPPDMEEFIGKEGKIIEYIEFNRSFLIKFENPRNETWSYPEEVILPQLEEQKELLGYLIKTEKYLKIIASLVGTEYDNLQRISSDGIHFYTGSYVYNTVVKYDLLDKCTPVYKTAEVKLPKINGYDGEDKGDYLQYGCAKLLKSWFEKSESRSINSLELSSHVTISSRQMEEIRKYLLSIKK